MERRANTFLAHLCYICDTRHMQRTIRIRLEPSLAQAVALTKTSRQFTAAFNHVCRHGWQQRLTNSVKLHHETYYGTRKLLPLLPTNLLIQARVKATEAIKSALALCRKVARKENGQNVGMPQSTVCPPRYNARTYTVDWQSRTVRLALVGGRQTIHFAVPDYSAKYVGYLTDTADLIERDGCWWLHVVVTIPAPDIAQTDQVVGVDLGLAHPAVTSQNRFLGKKAWKAIEGRLFHLKRALAKKGTKSAKRHLRKVRHRQRRFRRDCDHVLSKQIVQSVEPGSTIVLENLKHIRRRMKAKRRSSTKRRMHAWSFAQLKGFIGYKAEEQGCMVVTVDPRHTSQRCSCCGHTARNNRRSQGDFWCRQCHMRLNADLNAARNIAAKYHAGGGRSPDGGLSVMQPIVSSGCDPIGTSSGL
jgi:putative transposase